MLSTISSLETYLSNTLLNYLQHYKEQERNTMGGCFSLPGCATENPVNGLPEQPGLAQRAKSLCQSICNFFMEFFYSRWANGRFGKSMIIAKMRLMKGKLPNGPDGNVMAGRKNDISLIKIHNPDNKKSDQLGETKRSLDQEELSNAREVTNAATKEQDIRASTSNPNSGTGVKGSEVAGNNGADDSVV